MLGAVEAAWRGDLPGPADRGARRDLVVILGILGGAHGNPRVGDPFFAPVVLGILAWGGLYLRDPKLRAFLPLRSK